MLAVDYRYDAYTIFILDFKHSFEIAEIQNWSTRDPPNRFPLLWFCFSWFSAPHLAVERLEVAGRAQEHILVGLKDFAVDDDAGVAQDAMLPLLVELPEELPVVRGDLHVLFPIVHLCSSAVASPRSRLLKGDRTTK